MSHRFLIAGLMVWMLPATASAQTAEEITDALGIPQADILSVSLELGTSNMLGTTAAQGTINAFDDPMGYLGSGYFSQLADCDDIDLGTSGEPGDRAEIRVELTTPPGIHGFSFASYFLSREYPQFVGSEYNDSYTVWQDSSAFQGNIVFDLVGSVIDVNSALFAVTNPALLLGTGFDCPQGGGGTGWIVTVSPATAGETFSLTFSVGDVSDGVWDSGVFIDNFQWTTYAPPAPCTAHVGDDLCGDDDDDFPTDDDDTESIPAAGENDADHPASCAVFASAGSSISIVWIAGAVALFVRRRI